MYIFFAVLAHGQSRPGTETNAPSSFTIFKLESDVQVLQDETKLLKNKGAELEREIATKKLIESELR